MGAEATTHGDTYHRHGEVDPSKWNEAPSVTGRPVDEPGPNSTLASRAKAKKSNPVEPEPAVPDAPVAEVDEPVKAEPSKPRGTVKKAPARKG